MDVQPLLFFLSPLSMQNSQTMCLRAQRVVAYLFVEKKLDFIHHHPLSHPLPTQWDCLALI